MQQMINPRRQISDKVVVPASEFYSPDLYPRYYGESTDIVQSMVIERHLLGLGRY